MSTFQSAVTLRPPLGSIGHHARVPIHVLRAPISKTAKTLWTELALLSSPEKPDVWIRQNDMAKKVDCDVRTLRRAIEELIQNGLLAFAGWKEGRLKQYKLTWRKIFGDIGQFCPTSPDKIDLGPRTFSPYDVGQNCSDINRIDNQNIEQIILPTQVTENKMEKTELKNEGEDRERQSLLTLYGDGWRQRFACLDGQSGRPTLEESMDAGLCHDSRRQYRDLKAFMNVWLARAAKMWWDSFNREQKCGGAGNAVSSVSDSGAASANRPELPFGMSQQQLAEQKKRQEEANKWAWGNKGRLGEDGEVNGRYVPEIQARIDAGDLDGLRRVFYQIESWRAGLRANRVA